MMNKDGIETKTEIEVPLALAQLYTLAMKLKDAGAVKTAKSIFDLITQYLLYQVSHDRKGRSEIFNTLAAIVKDERSKLDKMTNAPEETI